MRIVRSIGARWLDADGVDWSGVVPFDVPDQDVFVIEADRDEPRVESSISGVGTILFNLAVQPGNS